MVLSARQPPESGLRLSFRVRICAKSSSAQGRDLDPGTQRMHHKYLGDAHMRGVSQRWWGLLEGRPGGTGTAQQQGELKAGIAEISISLAREPEATLDRGASKSIWEGSGSLGGAWGSLAWEPTAARPVPGGGQPGHLGTPPRQGGPAAVAAGTLPWPSSGPRAP